MRNCLVLLALACGLAACTAQLMNAAVSSTSIGNSAATTATVTFTSTTGQSAATSNEVKLPCFSTTCVCDPNTGLPAVAPLQVTWTSPTSFTPTCPASGTATGTSGSSNFGVSHSSSQALLPASPTFTVSASTSSTSATNSLTIDKGSGYAALNLGGNAVSLQGQDPAIAGNNVKSGFVTDAALVFKFTTAVNVPANGKVIVNLPYNYLATGSGSIATSTANFASPCAISNTPANPTACPPVLASGKIECTVSTLLNAGTITLSFTARSSDATNGWMAGNPGVTGGYTVHTETSVGAIIEGPAATVSPLVTITKGALSVAPTLTFTQSTDLNAQLQATTGTLALAFTPVNSVPVGGKFVLTTPLGYFRSLAFTSCSTGATCTANCGTKVVTNTNDIWTCTTAGANAAMTATSVTWTAAATAGGVTSWNVLNNQAAGTFSVGTQTSAGFVIDDAVSSAANGAPAIGSLGTISVSAVTTSSFSAPTDNNPGLASTTGTLTLSAITSSVALKVGVGALVFTFPYQYIKATSAPYTTGGAGTTIGTCTTADFGPAPACPPATGSAGFTRMTCSIATADTITTAFNLVLTSGWRITSNLVSGTFTVQGMANAGGVMGVVTAVSSPAALPAAGGAVAAAAASAASATTDRIPGVTTTGTLTLGFTPTSPLMIGSTIVFTLPARYMTGSLASATSTTGTVTCTLSQAQAQSGCTAAQTTSTIRCVTAGAITPASAQTVTFPAGSWSLLAGATGSYTVTTFNADSLLVDRASPAGSLVAATAAGAVSSVLAAVFSASTDQTPGLTTTTGTLKFAFTTSTTLPSGTISISIQGRYLTQAAGYTSTMGASAGTGPSGTCTLNPVAESCAQVASVANCGLGQDAQGAYQILSCPFSTSLTAGAVTLSLTAGTYSVGSSQPMSRYNVATMTSAGMIDVYSTAFGSLPALAAGAVTAVQTAAFSVPGDMVPGTTATGTLTFGFTTATDLVQGAKVYVQLPLGYLASATQAKLGTANINCGLTVSTQGCAPTQTSSQLMTCTTTAAAAKGAQTLILQVGGFVVGTKNTAAGISYRVWTGSNSDAIIDTVGAGAVPAITAGGSASGSGTATASVTADMVPGTSTSGTFSLAFKTETLLPMTNGKIVFRLTPGYLRTATAATLTGGSTTSTCSSLSLIQGSVATGCAAAQPDTLICTIGTANLAAGTYSLVLTAAAWTVGPNQPAGAFSVSTINGVVELDAASTTTGILPAIGSTVSVTSFVAATSDDLKKIGTAGSNTLSIGFTTSSALPSSSTISFTLPRANYLTTVTTASMTGQSTTAPTCSLQSSNTVLRCVLGGALPAGQSTIVLAAGWIPGTTVSSASFPTIANFNKATYTISNLQTPARYLAAASYTSYQANYGSSECSASLSFPQFGTAPSPPPGSPGAKAASGMNVILSAVVACAVAFVLLL